jgi:hypothetical protein
MGTAALGLGVGMRGASATALVLQLAQRLGPGLAQQTVLLVGSDRGSRGHRGGLLGRELTTAGSSSHPRQLVHCLGRPHRLGRLTDRGARLVSHRLGRRAEPVTSPVAALGHPCRRERLDGGGHVFDGAGLAHDAPRGRHRQHARVERAGVVRHATPQSCERLAHPSHLRFTS